MNDRNGILPAGPWWALSLAVLLMLGGCNDDTSTATRGPATQADARGGLFESVAENLNRLEEFETDQILKQSCDRLNQWYVQERPQIAWRPDPLLDELSDELRHQPDLQTLDTVRFQTPDDGWFLQEAVWLRNISNRARADQFQDLAVAERLFDWTVRNIWLTPDEDTSGEPQLPHLPYETLLLGRGTAQDRAWVFILLARQQGLNVVMLGVADEPGGTVRPWLPALVLDDELYLFDPWLGLPIPGPEPDSVATLSQVIADESLLRKLDLDQEHPYPVQAADLKHVVAYVEASPPALSRRMALVESRLSGENKMKLTSPGSSLAERVEKIPHIDDAKLWPVPLDAYLARTRRTPAQTQAATREMVLYRDACPEAGPGVALQRRIRRQGGAPSCTTSTLGLQTAISRTTSCRRSWPRSFPATAWPESKPPSRS